MQLELISKHRNVIYGVAIFWIALFHGCELNIIDYSFGQGALNWLQSIISMGDLGVDIFLFLSGVCLYYSFNTKQDAYSFLRKRLMRVVPSVLVVYGLYWTIRYGVIENQWGGVLGRFTLMQFWLTGEQSIWFVSLILVLYACYPYIYWFLFRKRNNVFRICFLLGASYLTILAIGLVAHEWYCNVGIALYRIPVFFFGCWFAKFVYEKKRMPKAMAVICLIITIVFVALLSKFDVTGAIRRVLYFPAGVVIAYTIAMIADMLERCDLIKKTAGCFFMFLGSISLELYLTHIMFNQILRLSAWYVEGSLLQYIIVVALSVLLAYVTKRISVLIGKRFLQ